MRITMINSVGEYEAGKSYTLKKEEAEHFIINGYADGELDREITAEEREQMEKNQAVGLG